jgi:hypothetical protein
MIKDQDIRSSIRMIALYASTQHKAFRTNLLESCRALVQDESELKAAQAAAQSPQTQMAMIELAYKIDAKPTPTSWVMAAALTKILTPVENESPDKAHEITNVLEAMVANRIKFEAIDNKDKPAPAKAPRPRRRGGFNSRH